MTRAGCVRRVACAMLVLALCVCGKELLGASRWFEIGADRIVTVAGGAELPDHLSAREIAFYGVRGLDADPRNPTLYLIDQGRSMVFRLDRQSGRVSPLAGTGIAGFNGDGRSGRTTHFHAPSDLAVDRRTGHVLVADTHNYRIREIAADGSRVTTVAGIGLRGLPPDEVPTEYPTLEGFAGGHFSGDGGPAADAELNLPAGIAVDKRGNLLIADSGNHRIRFVNRGSAPITAMGVEVAPGAIATVAGTGEMGFGGDGGPALKAKLAYPTEIAVAPDGDILFVDAFNQRLRRIRRDDGGIETVAEGSLAGTDPAEIAQTWQLSIVGLALDPQGRAYFSERLERKVLRLGAAGETEIVLDASAQVEGRRVGLGSLTFDAGEMIVADIYHNRLLRARGGELTILAGGALEREGVAAEQASFSVLGPVTTDPEGNLYIPDAFRYSVRKILARDGRVVTYAGNGRIGSSGDGGAPQRATLVHPTDVLVDGAAVYIVDQYANAVRRIVRSAEGEARIETFLGGRGGAQPDDGPLRLPLGAAHDPARGILYIAAQGTHSLYRVDGERRPIRFAGTGVAGAGGDGGAALEAAFNWPSFLEVDALGNLYVSDLLNHRIRRITPGGEVSTFAGTGEKGFSGDGGPAREASLSYPAGLAFDRVGNLYMADANNHRIRRIDKDPPHRITTVVGTGKRGYSGDGGPPREARLNLPRGLAFGPDGVLYIADAFNRRIRAVRFAEEAGP